MKVKLAPKHSQKIGDNVVLWFEISNSYIVISYFIFQLLNTYLESDNEKAFIELVKKKHNLTLKVASNYKKEITEFLNEVNALQASELEGYSCIKIPDAIISKYYGFGDSKVVINYGSNVILQLIDPYLHHCTVENSANAETVFDIFYENERLHLYKNKLLVGTYITNQFHFLHGKFAMELVTSLYDNTESDWLATFHASTICNYKEAIMIIGESGNGKSTLSAILMAHGFDLLADDFTPMLAENQNLYRFPAAISIKKGAFPIIEPLFENFARLESHINNSKQVVVKYLPPSNEFHQSNPHFECRKIVLVKYDQNSIAELKECPPELVLQTLIPDSWVSPKEEHAVKFLTWLTTLKFYQLTYSDNDMAITKFKELFED